MKTKYQYIQFTLTEEKPKTLVWDCAAISSGHSLGEVRWCTNWRQYCFYPECACLFSAGCLMDVADFLKQLNEDY